MDLHDPQFQGFFDIPVDNLFGRPLLQRFIERNIPNYSDAVIVSPDAGGAKRATAIADSLQMDFALIHKDRRSRLTGQYDDSQMMLVGDVYGKTAILVDDLADTANTLTRAASLLHKSGATSIYALVTHALLSGDAIQRLKESRIDVLVVTNSSPQDEHIAALRSSTETPAHLTRDNTSSSGLSNSMNGLSIGVGSGKHGMGGIIEREGRPNGQIVVLDVAPVFAEAIRRIHNGESVSLLFEYGGI